MKKKLFVIVIIMVVFNLYISSNDNNCMFRWCFKDSKDKLSNVYILIDPGHGENARPVGASTNVPGSCTINHNLIGSPNNIMEKRLTTEYALQLKK